MTSIVGTWNIPVTRELNTMEFTFNAQWMRGTIRREKTHE